MVISLRCQEDKIQGLSILFTAHRELSWSIYSD